MHTEAVTQATYTEAVTQTTYTVSLPPANLNQELDDLIIEMYHSGLFDEKELINWKQTFSEMNFADEEKAEDRLLLTTFFLSGVILSDANHLNKAQRDYFRSKMIGILYLICPHLSTVEKHIQNSTAYSQEFNRNFNVSELEQGQRALEKLEIEESIETNRLLQRNKDYYDRSKSSLCDINNQSLLLAEGGQRQVDQLHSSLVSTSEALTEVATGNVILEERMEREKSQYMGILNSFDSVFKGQHE